jgi:hypothetical protein
MKFFDMIQLISSRYNDLVAAQRWKKNEEAEDMMKKIIDILNTYRVKTFSSEDNSTIFFTFRSESGGRGGWGSNVKIVRFAGVNYDLSVKYPPSENANDPIDVPCAGVEFHPIHVVEIDEVYKTLLIEFVESGSSTRNCILTEPNNPTVLTDKPCDNPDMYEPNAEGEHMMFFPLNDTIYRIILSEMAEVIKDLLSTVEKKTDMRRKAFENAIKETTNKVKIDKLGLILYELSPQDKIKEVDLHTKYHPKSLIDLDNNAVEKLFARRIPALGGKKLRSAKKTSKRRSVKSKPRHYRRSVGGINHRRKKTTRRRQ